MKRHANDKKYENHDIEIQIKAIGVKMKADVAQTHYYNNRLKKKSIVQSV